MTIEFRQRNVSRDEDKATRDLGVIPMALGMVPTQLVSTIW